MNQRRGAAGKTLCNRRTAMKVAGAAAAGVVWGKTLCARAGGASGAISYEEYSQHDGLGLAELVQKKAVKPEELLEAAIARTEAVNPAINAVVVKCYEQAREAIRQGLPDGPFKGVPFLVKDVGFWMQDTLCTFGSRLFQDHVAKSDDVVVQRYRAAGLVIFGRTAGPEFGLLPITESRLHGITRNPWNLDWNAGGSSGGSAAAVAVGMAPMGSGSDAGGSIRIPASCCGLFGVKPTRCRVPMGPRLSDGLGGLATLHALTRSVRDSAALMDATCAADQGAPYRAPTPPRSFLDETKVSPGQLRIALVQRVPGLEEVHPQCQQAAENAAKLCEQLGHEVEDVTDLFQKMFPFAELRPAMWVPGSGMLALAVQDRLAESGRELDDLDLEPITRSAVEAAKKNNAIDIARATRCLESSSRMMADFLGGNSRDGHGFDLILSPTLAQPAFPNLGPKLFEPPSDLGDRFMEFCPYNALANWTGQPAMSVPWDSTRDGLPVGVQFMGRYGDEATLFRLAAQLERERPWADKWPDL